MGTQTDQPPRDELLARLVERFGTDFSSSQQSREAHGHDESYHTPHLPDAVVTVQSTEDVSDLVKLCAEYRCPVIPYGMGSSLEGQVIPLQGGVTVDFSAMNKVLRLAEDDLDVTVQAGVKRSQLNDYLKDSGLFFPIGPGADATMGGMAGTRASGTNAVRYGTMRENVLGMTVVMADGEIITTGGRARKSASGYDLTHLMIGSEGTLGIITELTLRLHAKPEVTAAAVCNFNDLQGAVETVIKTIQADIPVARIELLDEVQIDAINRYRQLDYALKPTLFIEFSGSRLSVAEQAEKVAELSQQQGGGEFNWSTAEDEKKALWQARHDAAPAALALRPGSKMWATDVCVPISRLAECILETRKDINASGIVAPIVGHVGDGNFHTVILVDENNPEEKARSIAFNERLLERALAMGGTITGEHGIGSGKRAFLEQEHGSAVQVMRQIKLALDPLGILNPGKIV